jgi:hypothetical protein
MAETLSLQAPRPARPSTAGANQSLKVIIAFALVYVFWGSTYIAIGMTSAAGIPPFVMCAVRFAIAGPLMLAACALFGRRVRISRPEAVRFSGCRRIAARRRQWRAGLGRAVRSYGIRCAHRRRYADLVPRARDIRLSGQLGGRIGALSQVANEG